ncbi:MAG: hypothetical protein WC564_01175 [Patescibacteria group bacterium]|jgi:hypothetical protein
MGERNLYKIDGRVVSTPGGDLTPEEKLAEEKLIADLTHYFLEAGNKTIIGELFKTDEEKKIIRRYNGYIKSELDDLGCLDTRGPLPMGKVHFSSSHNYHKQFPHIPESVIGQHNPITDAVHIKKGEKISRLKVAYVILHEMIHAFSATRYDFNESGLISSVKSGYSVSKKQYSSEKDPENSVTSDELFLGFNEAIVDLMAQEIFKKHQDEIFSDLNMSEEELSASSLKYSNYCPYIEWLIDKVAEENNEDRSVVWKKFKTGLLTGKIMHLREIEKALGVGALRLVAKFGNSQEDNSAFKDFQKNYDNQK